MDVNIGRLKKWDWGVGIAFLVTFIANFIPWWKLKMPDLPGIDLGGLVGGLDTSVWGWDFGAGRAAFCFALFAVIWVAVKIILPANQSLPKWYAESWGVLGFGGIVTLCGIIAAADAPGGGFSSWSWRPGGLIVLVAGIVILYCGYMMLRDKSGDYGQSEMPKLNVNVIKADGTTTQVGGTTPPAAGGKFCVGCGKPLDEGAAFCKNCGKQA
jgi:hypothetical protein